jgi:hypothetical protein
MTMNQLTRPSPLGRVAALLRGTGSGEADRPIIYGPASIWTEPPPVKGAPIVTRREPLKGRRHNDPAEEVLLEVGNALLEAAHTDALQHGISRIAAGAGRRSADDERLSAAPAAMARIGRRLILARAWMRPDYYAYILTTAPVVSNEILSRLTSANLAANVAAHTRFTRGQVLARLHTEYDSGDTQADVLVSDPARSGVFGTYVIFDRDEATGVSRLSVAATAPGHDTVDRYDPDLEDDRYSPDVAGGYNPDEEDDEDDPFADGPWDDPRPRARRRRSGFIARPI